MTARDKDTVLTREDLLLEMREMRTEFRTEFNNIKEQSERSRTAIEGSHRELAKEIGRVDTDLQVHRAETKAAKERADGHHRTMFGDKGDGGLVRDITDLKGVVGTLRWILGVLTLAVVTILPSAIKVVLQWFGGA